MACKHSQLSLEVSEHALHAGYQYPTLLTRSLAITTFPKEKPPKAIIPPFPAPLLLPNDDLAFDPECPPQNVQSWLQDSDRNEVTKARRTIYIIDYPSMDASIDFMSQWSWPMGHHTPIKDVSQRPAAADVAEYIRAFYHDLPVKVLPLKTLRFTPWTDNRGTLTKLKSGNNKQKIMIGLETNSQRLGVQTRPAPDGRFERQINLNHVLDAVIEVLPDDAYSALLLVDQDMYEGDGDDFCCGHAYGGSRVAVVSTARYNPILDQENGVDLTHAWPNSHCLEYIRSVTGLKEEIVPREAEHYDLLSSSSSSSSSSPPLRLASNATKTFRIRTSETIPNKWLGRVCRTASHELGHCLGMEHCVYYACVMQGTASLAEDVRQPPYLCPVDKKKLDLATGVGEEERLKALASFCRSHSGVELFVAYAAWIEGRLQQIAAVKQ